MIFRVDGFETLSQLAQQDEVVFMRLSHLVLTRQVPELEVPMKHQFGEDFLSRYNQACERMPYIQPIDLADIS
jgi:hypothetical protein